VLVICLLYLYSHATFVAASVYYIIRRIIIVGLFPIVGYCM